MDINQASLVPSDVTVGSRAQVLYRFNPETIPPFSYDELASGSSVLESVNKAGVCTVLNARFEYSGGTCTVVADIIPWQSGALSIPPLTFGSPDSGSEEDSAVFAVQIPPLVIRSVVEETASSMLAPPASPVVIPGTTYVVYGAVVASVVLCVCIIAFLFHIQNIRHRFHGLRRSFSRWRNYRRFLKQIKLFLRTKDAPPLAATKLTSAVRVYLECRFLKPCTAATTDEIMLLLQIQNEAALYESICTVVRVLERCDKVRFGAVSEATFKSDEMQELASLLKTAVQTIEKEP